MCGRPAAFGSAQSDKQLPAIRGAEKFVELPYRTAAGMAPYLLLCCAGCLGVVSGARTGEAMDRPLALWKAGFDPEWAQRAEGKAGDKPKRGDGPRRSA